MHTNTSRILTSFSDLEPDNDLTFPSTPGHARLPSPVCRDVRPDVADPLRHPSRPTESRRRRLARRAFGYDGSLRTRGRGQRAVSNAQRANRSRARTRSRARRGRCRRTTTASRFPISVKRVLVAGGAISALEIASELAQLGAAVVVVTQRRQRYVLPKFAAGVPSDSPDLHPVRHPRQRGSPAVRSRSTAEGDRRRGGRQPGAVRRART